MTVASGPGAPLAAPLRGGREGARVFAGLARAGLGLRARDLAKLDQAQKGIWWMPWHREAMKDVARCDKPRGGASNL